MVDTENNCLVLLTFSLYVLLFYAALIEVSPEMLDNDIEQLIDAAMTSLYEQCKIDQDEFVLPMLPPGGSIDDIIVGKEQDDE